MPVTVSALVDQSNLPHPLPVLYCESCGETYSAHKGDYFNRPDDYTFICCEEPMELVIVKKTIIKYEHKSPGT